MLPDVPHFFVSLENVIFLLVIYTCFLVGLFFTGAGGIGRVPSALPNDFGPPQAEKCLENISLKKKHKSWNCKFAFTRACFRTFKWPPVVHILGIFFLSCSPQAKKNLGVFVLFQKAASYTHFLNLIPPPPKKKKKTTISTEYFCTALSLAYPSPPQIEAQKYKIKNFTHLFCWIVLQTKLDQSQSKQKKN